MTDHKPLTTTLFWMLDDNGEPQSTQDFHEWAWWYWNSDRQLAYDRIGKVSISTFFIGVDHGFWNPEGPPLLYETSIMGGTATSHFAYASTREQALENHEAAKRKTLS